ncbi:MAG: hypothetical protein ACJATT_004797 [Myxococcota bacterium]|jgi:hypothetical protein
MVFKRFPVTSRDDIAFLDDLGAQGHEDDAGRRTTRERGGQQGQLGAQS